MVRRLSCCDCVYFTTLQREGRFADYCARDGGRVDIDSSCEFLVSEKRVQTRYADNCAKLEWVQAHEGWKSERIANLQEAIDIDRFTLEASKRFLAKFDGGRQ